MMDAIQYFARRMTASWLVSNLMQWRDDHGHAIALTYDGKRHHETLVAAFEDEYGPDPTLRRFCQFEYAAFRSCTR